MKPNPFRAANSGTSQILIGEIGLGIIEDAGIPWAVSPKLLTNNMLCAGRSGGGKTNLLLLILAQVLERSLAKIRIFDRKLDYACLSIFPDFIYWLLEDFFTNWIQPPPGLHYRRWVTLLYEIFANYLDIRIAGRNLLTSATLWTCEQRKSDQTGDYPTLRDIRNIIRSRRYPLQSHHARYQETVLNRIDGVLDIFGEHVCSKRQLDWNKFLSASWAISLFGIPTDYQNLFISVTIGSVLLHKMAANYRSY